MVWGHHMFVAGQSQLANLVFSFLSFIVAVPSAIKVFNWTATIYRGQIGFEAPMLYALGFLGLFTIGGLTGLFVASVPIDIAATDTYFVVAHFHTIMVGGTVSAYMAGIHYWWPKVTGRLYNEFCAQFAAITMFLGFNVTFLPQFVMGWHGMPRRYHVYPEVFQFWHTLSSVGALILAVAYLFPLVYLTWSLFHGERAGDNPWHATGLEWQTSSPPPKQNFLRPPRIDADALQVSRVRPPAMKPGERRRARRRESRHERRLRRLQEPWPDLAMQREGVGLGMWVFLASEVLFFGVLIVTYAVYRSFNAEAFRAAGEHTQILYGTINTVLLLTVSVTMTVALRAATARLRRLTLACLMITPRSASPSSGQGRRVSRRPQRGPLPRARAFALSRPRPKCSGCSIGS